jgi:hypothetical protein
MTQALRLAALALWLASLLWPAAISPHGDTLLGIQLLLGGTLLLAAWLPLTLLGSPWLWLGVLSNGLMLAELRRQRQPLRPTTGLGALLLLLGAAVHNVMLIRPLVALLPSLRLHAYYLWAASFVLLALAAVSEHPALARGVLLRSLLLLGIALLTGVAGVAAIVLLH